MLCVLLKPGFSVEQVQIRTSVILKLGLWDTPNVNVIEYNRAVIFISM